VADVHKRAGDVDQALAVFGEALEQVEQTGQRIYEAELHRLEGETLLRRVPAPTAAAEARFHRALTIAQKQKARWWELRAAISLARLWQAQGKPREACEVLKPVYAWFTEGFDTPDLREAKVLLDELR
jgi:predicted ATPase